MTFPASPAIALDARLTSQITLLGSQVTDGSVLDTWNNFTQAVGANQPTYDSMSMGNGPCVTHGGLGGPLNQVATYVANAGVTLGFPMSVVIVFRGDWGTTLGGALCELSTDVAANNGIMVTNYGPWTVQARGPSGNSLADHGDGQNWGNRNEIHYLIVTRNGTSTVMYLDGVQVANLSTDGATTGVWSASTPCTVGAAHGGAVPLTGAIGAVYVYNRLLNVNERAQIDADVRGSWRLTTRSKIKYNKLMIGDSVLLAASTKYAGAAPIDVQYSCMGVASSQLGGVYGFPRDLGISGAQLQSNIPPQWTATGKFCLINGSNIVLVQGGVNDLGDGRSVAQVNNDFQNLVTQVSSDMSAKAATGRQFCVVCTIFGNSSGANRTAVNANTVANYQSWGATGVTMVLADFGADPVFSSVTPIPEYTADGVHPTLPGNQRLGTILANALLAAGAT